VAAAMKVTLREASDTIPPTEGRPPLLMMLSINSIALFFSAHKIETSEWKLDGLYTNGSPVGSAE
jgi:hypothetical protein